MYFRIVAMLSISFAVLLFNPASLLLRLLVMALACYLVVCEALIEKKRIRELEEGARKPGGYPHDNPIRVVPVSQGYHAHITVAGERIAVIAPTQWAAIGRLVSQNPEIFR